MKLTPERYAAFQQGIEYGAREAVKEAFAQLKKQTGCSYEKKYVHQLAEVVLKEVKNKLKK